MLSFTFKSKRQTKISNLGCLTLERAKIATERLSNFAFFSPQAYSSRNPDIGPMDPAMHFVGYGADERRVGASPALIASTLGELESSLRIQQPPFELPVSLTKIHVGIFVSSQGNAFMSQIAMGLAELLNRAGHRTELHDENSDIERRPKNCIYVAPHEFFFLGRGPQWIRDDILSTACMYCTEQVQTEWFWQSLHVVLMAHSVIDMSQALASAFRRVMPSACIFPLAVIEPFNGVSQVMNHPLLSSQSWWNHSLETLSPTRKRPLDVCFFGAKSAHRSRFLAANAQRLSNFESFIYTRSRNSHRPMSAHTGESVLVDVARHVMRNSTVLLNVHRDEFPYFEWHRLVLQAMMNGAAVISEPCFTNPDFKDGVHFLTEESRHLMDLVEWALNDPDGKERASSVADAALTEACNGEKADIRAAELVSLLPDQEAI